MLTRTGVGALVAAMVLLAAGWSGDYPELVAVAGAFLAALLVGGCWILLARLDVSAWREVRPLRVGVGGEARGLLVVTNDGRRRTLPIMVRESLDSRVITIPIPSLAAGESRHVTYALPTDRRGVFRVGPLTVAASDPFRLLRRGREYATSSTLTVHPRIHAVAPVPTSARRNADGPTSGMAPRGGVAFHSLREYESGDDWRLIHWKSTARLGSLMVRHNVVLNEPRVMIVLDTSAGAYTATGGTGVDFEDAASAAASLAMAVVRARLPLLLMTTAGARAEVDRGADPGRALDLLAAAGRSTRDAGLAALSAMVSGEDDVALAVVTGQPTAALLAVLPALRNRFVAVSLVQITGTYQAAGPPLRGVTGVSARDVTTFVAAWNRLVNR